MLFYNTYFKASDFVLIDFKFQQHITGCSLSYRTNTGPTLRLSLVVAGKLIKSH